MRITFVLNMLLILSSLFTVSTALALRCGSDLIHEGDHTFEVLNACGEPLWRERWENQNLERTGFDTLEKRAVIVEEWIYDFGPNRLLHILRFRNNRLVDIETGDRGRRLAFNTCRDGRMLSIGDTKVEVVRKCGVPDYSDSRENERLVLEHLDEARKMTIRIDEWTYNFGPHRFLYHLTFENGRLKEIETGDYGY